MQAVRLVAYGDAVEGIAVHEVPEPAAPGPGEVLVQVSAELSKLLELLRPAAYANRSQKYLP